VEDQTAFVFRARRITQAINQHPEDDEDILL
jgi:hypothetical protein